MSDDSTPDEVPVDEELLTLSQAVRDHLLMKLLLKLMGEPMDAGLPAADLEAVGFVVETKEDGRQTVQRPAVDEVRDPWRQVADAERAVHEEGASTDGTGAEGLAAIRADLGECTRCGLCEGRQNLVFGVGDPDADLMVIGEGPGAREDERGEPFVGEAGAMLDRMLANVIGLPRERVYIANVVKCRPPDNRNPEEVEARTCLPFLRRQIAAVRPKVILLLGTVALRYVAGRSGIKRHRGQQMLVDGIPTIPTFHPAYLLRVPQDKRLTFEDLKQVAALYDRFNGRR